MHSDRSFPKKALIDGTTFYLQVSEIKISEGPFFTQEGKISYRYVAIPLKKWVLSFGEVFEFNSECSGFMRTAVSKLLERSPLKYSSASANSQRMWCDPPATQGRLSLTLSQSIIRIRSVVSRSQMILWICCLSIVKLKSNKVSFVHNLFCIYPIVLQFYTELCAQFQKGLVTEQ